MSTHKTVIEATAAHDAFLAKIGSKIVILSKDGTTKSLASAIFLDQKGRGKSISTLPTHFVKPLKQRSLPIIAKRFIRKNGKLPNALAANSEQNGSVMSVSMSDSSAMHHYANLDKSSKSKNGKSLAQNNSIAKKQSNQEKKSFLLPIQDASNCQSSVKESPSEAINPPSISNRSITEDSHISNLSTKSELLLNNKAVYLDASSIPMHSPALDQRQKGPQNPKQIMLQKQRKIRYGNLIFQTQSNTNSKAHDLQAVSTNIIDSKNSLATFFQKVDSMHCNTASSNTCIRQTSIEASHSNCSHIKSEHQNDCSSTDETRTINPVNQNIDVLNQSVLESTVEAISLDSSTNVPSHINDHPTYDGGQIPEPKILSRTALNKVEHGSQSQTNQHYIASSVVPDSSKCIPNATSEISAALALYAWTGAKATSSTKCLAKNTSISGPQNAIQVKQTPSLTSTRTPNYLEKNRIVIESPSPLTPLNSKPLFYSHTVSTNETTQLESNVLDRIREWTAWDVAMLRELTHMIEPVYAADKLHEAASNELNAKIELKPSTDSENTKSEGKETLHNRPFKDHKDAKHNNMHISFKLCDYDISSCSGSILQTLCSTDNHTFENDFEASSLMNPSDPLLKPIQSIIHIHQNQNPNIPKSTGNHDTRKYVRGINGGLELTSNSKPAQSSQFYDNGMKSPRSSSTAGLRQLITTAINPKSYTPEVIDSYTQHGFQPTPQHYPYMRNLPPSIPNTNFNVVSINPNQCTSSPAVYSHRATLDPSVIKRPKLPIKKSKSQKVGHEATGGMAPRNTGVSGKPKHKSKQLEPTRKAIPQQHTSLQCNTESVDEDETEIDNDSSTPIPSTDLPLSIACTFTNLLKSADVEIKETRDFNMDSVGQYVLDSEHANVNTTAIEFSNKHWDDPDVEASTDNMAYNLWNEMPMPYLEQSSVPEAPTLPDSNSLYHIPVHHSNTKPAQLSASSIGKTLGVKMGSLGPDKENETYLQKLEKQNRQREYSNQVRTLAMVSYSRQGNTRSLTDSPSTPFDEQRIDSRQSISESGWNNNEKSESVLQWSHTKRSIPLRAPSSVESKTKLPVIFQRNPVAEQLAEALSKREKMKAYAAGVRKSTHAKFFEKSTSSSAQGETRFPLISLAKKSMSLNEAALCSLKEIKNLEDTHVRDMAAADSIRKELGLKV
ncbi:hypothetical protein O5D80_005345 [Batrachochytrium dendrobatidis]|nr:hypothetical protein O5D80_005345 [Batrachochytrium dendrobatidis]